MAGRELDLQLEHDINKQACPLTVTQRRGHGVRRPSSSLETHTTSYSGLVQLYSAAPCLPEALS